MLVISGGIEKPGIFEPFPGVENFVDPPGLTVIFEKADPEFDDLVTIRIRAGGFHIHDSGDQLGTVIGWVVFGLGLQPTGDPILAALDERAGHLFQRISHLADVPNRLPQRSTRQGARPDFYDAAGGTTDRRGKAIPQGARHLLPE